MVFGCLGVKQTEGVQDLMRCDSTFLQNDIARETISLDGCIVQNLKSKFCSLLQSRLTMDSCQSKSREYSDLNGKINSVT